MWIPTFDTEQRPVFKALVRALASDIEEGRLEPGDRLPTHRELARELGLARGTVARAYAEAERAGLLRSEIGRGSYVGDSTVAGQPYRALRDTGTAVIDLAVCHPLYGSDADLGAALRKLARGPHLQALLRYQPQTGIPEHRAAGARWLRRLGIPTRPDEILPCAGAQHALVVTLSTLTEPGDLVLTEQLCYPGIRAVAETLRLRLHGLPMDASGLLPDELETACRNRVVRALYLLPTIQNPIATVMPEQRRRKIADIAERHGIPIVEDDIHRPYCADPPPAFKTLAPGRTYHISSLSKTLGGGLRVAYLAPPPGRTDALANRILATAWMASPLSTAVAAAWIDDGTAEAVIARKRAECERRQELAREVLHGRDFQAHPTAMFGWLTLPPGLRATDLAMRARRAGVAITPAEAFHVGSTTVPNGVRVCLGAEDDPARVREGLRIVADLLDRGRSADLAIV